MEEEARTFTAFVGTRQLATGDVRDVLRAVMAHLEDACDHAGLLIFDDATGGQVDFDLRGGIDDVLARLDEDPEFAPPAPPRPGRPKLGVVSREVSLLPRHWAWLERQQGGASAALRRLVEAASKESREADRARGARDAAGTFMWCMAGDLPGFEEATRALYAEQHARLLEHMRGWPADIRAYVVRRLALDGACA